MSSSPFKPITKMSALRTRTPNILASSSKSLATPLFSSIRAASTTPIATDPRSPASTPLSTINPNPTPHLYARPRVERRELPELKVCTLWSSASCQILA